MSAAVDHKLRQAADALAAGDAALAERLIREILAHVPRIPHALEMTALGWLGIALCAQGRPAEAVEVIGQAVARAPDDPGMHLNLAGALMQSGRLAEAIASYERALRLNPDYPQALDGLGCALMAAGDLEGAAARLRRAIDLDPRFADAHDHLGDALLRLGRTAEAEGTLRQAVALAPGNADYHAGLGMVLATLGRWGESLAEYERAVALRPDYPEALNSIGSVLLESGAPEAALQPIQRALALAPDYAQAHDNLAAALLRLGREEEGNASLRAALALQPDDAERHLRFATALRSQQRWEEALAHFGRALELKPDYAEARYERSAALLYRHEFEQAWPEYEWRFAAADFRGNSFRRDIASVTRFESLPRWKGPAETGVGELAVWAEQGIGDHVLFSTLLPELVAKGISIVYEIEERLLTAYRRAFPTVNFVPRAEPPHAALSRASRVIAAGSLPLHFRVSRDSFARQPTRLLSALPDRVGHYRKRLDALGEGMKVALSWRSSRRDWWVPKSKALPLAQCAPLLGLPGVQFVDVQYGDTADERRAVEAAAGARIARFEDVDHLNDLEEVLAMLEASDLVITTSSATAHFAGALGKRAWLIFPAGRSPFHYWAHGGSYRCLWYPSVEIVTAPHLANWPAVIEHVRERVASEIRAWTQTKDSRI